MSDGTSRHQLFQGARVRAEWSIQQLWVGYLAVGGTRDAFDIEAYLHGMGPLSDAEQDVLANAVNERLDDLYLAARVPYLAPAVLPPCRCHDPLAVLDDLFPDVPPTARPTPDPMTPPDEQET